LDGRNLDHVQVGAPEGNADAVVLARPGPLYTPSNALPFNVIPLFGCACLKAAGKICATKRGWVVANWGRRPNEVDKRIGRTPRSFPLPRPTDISADPREAVSEQIPSQRQIRLGQ